MKNLTAIRSTALKIVYSIEGYKTLPTAEKNRIYDAVRDAVEAKDAATLADIINGGLPWWEQVDPDELAAIL
jgi:hypothetical protein